MVRRFLTPIRVEAGGSAEPMAFRWKHRQYRVRAVHAHWVEAATWWRGSNAGSSGSSAQAVQVWRVEAVSHTGVAGVYDLVQSAAGWRLRRVID